MFIRSAFFLFIACFAASCTSKMQESIAVKEQLTDTIPDSTGSIDSICFEKDILPIFQSNCAIEACHDGVTGQEGIVFESYETFLYKGFIPGDAENSQVYRAITRTTSRRMPPIPTYALDTAQIALIRTWIKQGMPRNACKQETDTSVYTYSKVISPIIRNHCFGCHNDKSVNPNDILLQTYAQVKALADNGKLIGVITHRNGYKAMPYDAAPMDAAYISLIQKWVRDGAQNN